MLKTRIPSGKIFTFALALLFLFMVFSALFGHPAAIAAEPDATAVSDNGAQMGYWLGDGGPATSAGICPSGVAVDTSGNLYIADKSNNRIRKVDTAGIITTVVGNGTEGNSGDGGPATNAELAEPCGVAVDAAGNIYIADSENCAIRKVDSKGIITTIAGKGVNAGIATAGYSGYSGDNGPATSAGLNGPEAVVVDVYGNIYIADSPRIREVAAATAIQYGISMTAGNIYTVAGDGQGGYLGGYTGDGGPATGAELSQVAGVAVDASGNIYISDQNNNRIRKVDPSGIITTVAGGGTILGYSGNTEPATSAEICGPSGLAVDADNNLYITDGFACIRKMDTTTDTITTVAGAIATLPKDLGYSGDGGPATSAKMCPSDVAVDNSGNLYIADAGNNRIRKVDTTGIITTVAGNGSTIASGQQAAVFTVGQKSYALGAQPYAMDAPPFISNGRLLVPARFLADALGARTDWDPAKQQATITRVTRGFIVLELTIGSAVMESTSGYGNTAGTGKTIQMDMAPVIVNGRTYLPVRYVAEVFGFDVSWGAAAQTITLSQKEPLGSPQAAATS